MHTVPVIIIDSDDGSRFALKGNLEKNQSINIIGDYNNLITGYNAVVQEKPGIVFVDITENSTLALEIIEKISVKHKSCFIFVCSYESSTEIIMKSMRAGAREFFTKPIQFHDLNIAIEKARVVISSEFMDNSSGKIITVYSNKGGIGKTTIASNLAVSLAETTKQKVALVDLNLQLGDVTTFLDISPSFDISYVASHLNRIDEAFLLSTLERYKDKNLYVLADPPYLEQAEDITTEQITSVLGILKLVFSYIIIDTSSSFDNKTLCSLDLSDNILLVSMINLPTIRNCQRCLDLFKRLDYSEDKIKLVINRYMPNEEISIEDVEDTLGHPVYWKIPNNYFTVMSAINKGLPISVINPNSNINHNFMELAALMSNSAISNNSAKIEKSASPLLNLGFFNKILKQGK